MAAIARGPRVLIPLLVVAAAVAQGFGRFGYALLLPAVQAAIAKGRPLIAGFGERFETEPVGGHATMSKKSA